MKNYFVISLIVAVVPLSVSAEQDGKQLTASCVACHGDNGLSSNAEWPNLAGQQRDYLVKELNALKQGTRVNPLMPPTMLQEFTEQQLATVADYYASLPAAQIKASTNNIEGQYVRARCISCHGMTGVTVTSLWPNIAGQKTAYLKKQLMDYKSGQRRHPIMQVIASELTDLQITQVAEYYGGQ